jgi:hypothetical protein
MAAPATAPTPGINYQYQYRPNPVQSLGRLILLLYLFIIYSRIMDVKFWWLHIPGILLALLIILAPASTRVLAVLGDRRIGRYLVLFTLWAIAIVPFSVWRGGAFQHAAREWPREVMVFIGIGCMLATLRSVRHGIYALGFGIVALAVMARLRGDFSTGRLTLPAGLISNPNDLALAVLMGLPFLIFIIMEAGPTIKVLALAGMYPILWGLMRTGSRGGLLGFAVLVAIVFGRCSFTGKMMVIFGSVAVVATALFVLPHRTLDRYVTFFHSDRSAVEYQADDPQEVDDPSMEGGAATSADARYGLLKASIEMTLRYPLTGVGMGNFAAARHGGTPGTFVSWQVTHNSYTEVSSETGLVGFFFYMAAFVGCIRTCRQLSKFAAAKVHPEWQTISRLAFCLQTSLISYAVSSFFASVAYLQFFPTLAGLTLALAHSVQPQFEMWQKQTSFTPPAQHARPLVATQVVAAGGSQVGRRLSA